MSIYKAIGIMSGTSLDGLDLAYCIFDKKQGKWEYSLIKSISIEYDIKWRTKLANASLLSAQDLLKLDFEYGNYIGKLVSAFIKRQKLKPNLIASHGHTVFHNPSEGYTLQIGNGNAIASHVDCTVVNDFRSQDINLGGQGAPLVPIGDQLLFSNYDVCINLGGVANISVVHNNERIAWDIGFCNMVLNHFCKDFDINYDKDGLLASEGDIDSVLLNKFSAMEYYKLKHPKSLAREQFESNILPIINDSNISTKNKLRTWVEHIAIKISEDIPQDSKEVLITGGGVFNKFLMERIKLKTKARVNIPTEQLVESKEALIFAFLGALRLEGEVNILKSVTGASKNHSAGAIYY